jgi:hypothetical protein
MEVIDFIKEKEKREKKIRDEAGLKRVRAMIRQVSDLIEELKRGEQLKDPNKKED